MSKKTQWRLVATSHPTLLMTYEEKQEYKKKKRERDFKMFKWGQEVDRMPYNKPKLSHNKPVKDSDEY